MLQERLNPFRNAPKKKPRKQADDPGQRALVLGALGVVFGDIGTSPIYALREAVQTAHSTAPPVVMGVLSMILWAVLIVVVLKYACFVMRADNEGEGGIVALTALAHPALAFGVLAAVILALTGAEALYADIGHLGTRSIRIAFFCVVLPAIVAGYFGQAATVLFEPGGASQPFFRSVPHWVLIPAIGIAMLATIIASQAVISGAFSMTSQAIEPGFLPRMRTIETSSTRRGQIYVPTVNAGLLVAVVFLVLFFLSGQRTRHDAGRAREQRASQSRPASYGDRVRQRFGLRTADGR
ncbi:potassium transporter [Paraburkholderia silvatlantica]|uniref:Potassium transporter n=1 Tax=Paraburkholderia silvatlantica TaxID=321895 RepID=A0A2V4TP72_9BURK|nr:KUP/HAK/KT family potassium transporter [Paraburkholderia silvatlantica]PYE17717.1 potassium transporter [Paraburkholderia silvatlantica]